IPEDERTAAHGSGRAAGRGCVGRTRSRKIFDSDAGLESRRFERVFFHRAVILSFGAARLRMTIRRPSLAGGDLGLAHALFPGHVLGLLEEAGGAAEGELRGLVVALAEKALAFLLVRPSLAEDGARGLPRVETVRLDAGERGAQAQLFGGLAEL